VSRCNPTASAGDVGVLQSRPGIEEHHAVFRFQEARLQQMIVGDRAVAPSGERKMPSFFRPILERSEDLLVRKGEGDPSGFPKNLEHDVIAVGLWHAQT